MERGRPPLGFDKNPIVLHHALQSDKAALIEVSQKMHQGWTKVLHINPSSIPSGINRSAFNLYRESYWQLRLAEYLKK